MKRAWLELLDWEFVTATNAALCQPKKALRKPTSDGHDRTRQFWEKNHRREMFLDEAADLCREWAKELLAIRQAWLVGGEVRRAHG